MLSLQQKYPIGREGQMNAVSSLLLYSWQAGGYLVRYLSIISCGHPDHWLDDPRLDTRLAFIRRQSGLDSRAALFVLSPVSAAELGDFVQRFLFLSTRCPKILTHPSRAASSKLCMSQLWSTTRLTLSGCGGSATDILKPRLPTQTLPLC
jgi:hypothetical protein